MNQAWFITALPVIGWGVMSTAAALLGWALFWDRAQRGRTLRRRCPRCWYDMAGLAGFVCPECGHAAASEQALRRTRRRRGFAAVGVVMAMAAYPALVAPDVSQRGLRAAIPGTVLVLWPATPWPWFEDSTEQDGVMRGELVRRIEEHRLWNWQFRVLHWRIARAYARQGRYGVSAGQRRTLAVLDSRPLRCNPDGSWDSDVLGQVAAAGLDVRSGGSPIRIRTTPIELRTGYSPPTLLDGLAEAFEWPRSYGWAPEDGGIRLVPGYEFERQTTCVIYDVADLAPVSVVYEPGVDCGLSGPVGEPERQVRNEKQWNLMALIQDLVCPLLWDDSGGYLGQLWPVGQSLVVVASPAMHVRIERLLNLMRRAIDEDGSGARSESTAHGARQPNAAAGPALCAYNLSSLVGSGSDDSELWNRADDIVSSLMEEVDADDWWGNGGDRARCFLVPPLLIVEARPGTQDGVRRFLAARRGD